MLLFLLYSPEGPSSAYTADFSRIWDTKPSGKRRPSFQFIPVGQRRPQLEHTARVSLGLVTHGHWHSPRMTWAHEQPVCSSLPRKPG